MATLPNHDQLMEALAKCELFHTLSKSHLAALLPILKPVEYEAGKILFRKGELGDSLYILVLGSAGVFDDVDSPQAKPIYVYQPGGTFGHIALFTGGLRSLGAKAVTECTIIHLKREELFELMKADFEIAKVVVQKLAERIIELTPKYVSDPASK
jgi:CRP-like cAMP-binding protein